MKVIGKGLTRSKFTMNVNHNELWLTIVNTMQYILYGLICSLSENVYYNHYG